MKFYQLVVDKVIHETADAFSICFQNPDTEVFNYLPGQYLTLKVQIAEEQFRRAFSLSSAPGIDTELSVTIKVIQSGKVSGYLHENLKPGTLIDVYPPMGNFCIQPNPAQAKEYVLIGAGSGITPLFSMLKTVLLQEPNSKVRLLYGNRNEDSIIFKAALDALSQKYSNRLQITHVLSQPSASWQGLQGRLCGELLNNLLHEILVHEDLPQAYYLCGPQEMMDDATATLKSLAVPDSNIHREYYSAPVHIDEDEGEESYDIIPCHVKIKLDGVEQSVFVPAGTNVLQAVIDAGFDPPYACQEGICSTCRGKVHSGLVQLDFRDGLSDEELQAGYVLTCQTFPVSEDVFIEFA